MRLTWAPSGPGEVGQLGGVDGPVVDPVDERPLEATGAGPWPSMYCRQASASSGQRVAPVERHQLSRKRSLAACRETARLTGQGLGGQPADARDDPDRRDGQVAGRQPEVVVEPLDRRPDPVVVGQRLAHPHEHHVGQPARRPGGPRAPPTTCSTISPVRQVAGEAGLAGGAERAAHGAAGLARHAHRRPVRVVHQHRLHPGAVGQRPQPFDGLAAVGHLARGLGQGRGERRVQPFAQGQRQIGHLGRPPGPPWRPSQTWPVR